MGYNADMNDVEERTRNFGFLLSGLEKPPGRVIRLDSIDDNFQLLHESMMSEANQAGYGFVKEKSVIEFYKNKEAMPMDGTPGDIFYYFQLE